MPPPTACVRLHRLRGRGRGSRMARWEATVHRSRRSMYATVLWFLLFLFCLRVAGQALVAARSEEHTSELQSQSNLVCRLLLEKKKNKARYQTQHNETSRLRR